MLKLPEIDEVERVPDGLRLHFTIPERLEYFEGHFPGVPLLPGVVQIGWAVELARLHLGPSSGDRLQRFGSLSAVKFMHVIQPGSPVQLTLCMNPDSRELLFEYSAGEQSCSSGRVRFH